MQKKRTIEDDYFDQIGTSNNKFAFSMGQPFRQTLNRSLLNKTKSVESKLPKTEFTRTVT